MLNPNKGHLVTLCDSYWEAAKADAGKEIEKVVLRQELLSSGMNKKLPLMGVEVWWRRLQAG